MRKILIGLIVSLSVLLTGIASATIVQMDHYTLDTGEYTLYEPAAEVVLTTWDNPHITYQVMMHYPKDNPEITVLISEYDFDITEEVLDNIPIGDAKYHVNKPYPGYISQQNGTTGYVGAIDNRTGLIVITSEVNLATFLLQNLKVYTSERANEIVTAGMAEELQ